MNDRRLADLDPVCRITGEISKTSGNCAYSKCCIDQTKLNSVFFVEEENLNIHINKLPFQVHRKIERLDSRSHKREEKGGD